MGAGDARGVGLGDVGEHNGMWDGDGGGEEIEEVRKPEWV